MHIKLHAPMNDKRIIDFLKTVFFFISGGVAPQCWIGWKKQQLNLIQQPSRISKLEGTMYYFCFTFFFEAL
jgi:hypothetical protein